MTKKRVLSGLSKDKDALGSAHDRYEMERKFKNEMEVFLKNVSQRNNDKFKKYLEITEDDKNQFILHS